MKKMALLVGVFILVLSGCSNSTDEGFKTIAIEEVQSMIDEGYTVVDVREQNEYESGHIIDASNIPLSTLEKGNLASMDPNQQYIIICQSGNRSKVASQILHDEGYDIVNVSEGMSSWAGATE